MAKHRGARVWRLARKTKHQAKRAIRRGRRFKVFA